MISAPRAKGRAAHAMARELRGPQRSISIYSGRDFCGHVVGVDDRWCAFDALGNQLPGSFKSYVAASAAINVSRSSFCVADTSDRQDNS